MIGDHTETSLVIEPIKGWKVATPTLSMDGRELMFKPLTGWGSSYGVEAEAICNKLSQRMISLHSTKSSSVQPKHKAPTLGCTCGFYARKDREACEHSHLTMFSPPSVCMLEVDLTGKIIVHERGYRAEKQKVTAIHIVQGQCHEAGKSHLKDLVCLDNFTSDCSSHRTSRQQVASLDLLQDILPVSVTWMPSLTQTLNEAVKQISINFAVSTQQVTDAMRRLGQALANPPGGGKK